MTDLEQQIEDFDAMVHSEVGEQWQQLKHKWDALKEAIAEAMPKKAAPSRKKDD